MHVRSTSSLWADGINLQISAWLGYKFRDLVISLEVQFRFIAAKLKLFCFSKVLDRLICAFSLISFLSILQCSILQYTWLWESDRCCKEWSFLLLVEFPGRKRMFFHALCNFCGIQMGFKKILQYFFLQKICWLQRFRIVICQFPCLGFFFFSKLLFGCFGEFGN